ncbi:MAG: ATP synthase F1 subunit gamma [Clostridiales bacterium]|jgi:F-type H+-transporting ATPase subunit gamma|nr:ATP synthase F1 subunit gamma [Clostridiales bacterium]
MRNLSDIKLRIKAVSDTRQITGAMETISLVKMRRATQKSAANKQFFEQVRVTMRDILTHTKDVSHPYLVEKKDAQSAVFLVVASDKGLAGAYNHNVLSAATAHIQKHAQHYIFTVGQVAREYFEHRGMNVDVEFCHATHDPTLRDASEIAYTIMQLYDNKQMDEAYMVYSEPVSTGGAPKVSVLRLLPLDPGAVTGETSAFDEDDEAYNEMFYDPSPEQVLDDLVGQYLIGIIYSALVQSVAAEHSSRMVAMSNATRNADDILERLQLEYNRARQESVTSELSEIITASFGVNNEHE